MLTESATHKSIIRAALNILSEYTSSRKNVPQAHLDAIANLKNTFKGTWADIESPADPTSVENLQDDHDPIGNESAVPTDVIELLEESEGCTFEETYPLIGVQ